MIGTTVTHYHITAKLGQGGMGDVYRATDQKLGREVALKVLPDEMASSPERLDRFRREAKALAALDHPGIVSVFSVEEAVEMGPDGLERRIHFLTMQLVEGRSLDKVIPDGGLPLETLLSYATALTDALAAAHEKGIVHRDLKPANVIVTDGGRLKVLDFGLAKITAPPDERLADSEAPTDLQTREGVVMGTVPYMSPEQLSGRTVDHRSDIFSLGILLYEMAAGRRPFEGRSGVELGSSILRDTPPPLSRVRPDLPAELERVLSRCLEKEPATRYQSASELLEALAALGRGEESKPPTGPSLSPPPGPSIAVLPFRNQSGDPEQEAFAAGITEDIIGGLSQSGLLFVMGSSATERYRSKTVDVREIGRELEARYVLQGAVRKAGDRLRVSAQLVDASTGIQVWSQKYDRNLSASDVFDVQDEIREQIVATISDVHGIIYSTGLEEARSRPTENLDAHECVYVALAYDKKISPENHLRARESLERAVELDPDYSLAWGYLSWIYTDEYVYGFNALPDSMPRALAAPRRAVDLSPRNHINRWLLSRVYFFRREPSQFFAEAEKSLELHSSEGTTLGLIGVYTAYAGKWDRGLALMRKAVVLNPHHPGYYYMVFGAAHLRQGKYEEALLEYEKMDLPGFFLAQIPLVAVNAHLRRERETQAAMAQLLELRPGYNLEQCAEDLRRFGFPKDVGEPLLKGLRMAGLP